MTEGGGGTWGAVVQGRNLGTETNLWGDSDRRRVQGANRKGRTPYHWGGGIDPKTKKHLRESIPPLFSPFGHRSVCDRLPPFRGRIDSLPLWGGSRGWLAPSMPSG